MIQRRLLIAGASLVPLSLLAADRPRLTNIRFGIFREVSEGVFDFVSETNRLPRKYKATGFRWGIGFDNPDCKPIEWYEVVHLPAELKEVSGNFQRARTRTMRTKTLSSSQPTIVDDFWFDEGDPLGPHKLELFVNGSLRHVVDFQVVEDR
jgi:hypothetical protein